MGLFALMGIVWGVPYLLIKVAVGQLSPPTLVFVRTLIGGALLIPVAAARGDLRPLTRHWRIVLVYTGVEVAGPWLLLSHAEQRLSSSLTGLLVAAVPLVGAVIAWRTGGDRPDRRLLGGLLVGFAGVALLVGVDLSVRDLFAAAELGLVVVGYAMGAWLIARRLSDVPAVGVVAVSLLATAILYAPAGLLLAPHRPPALGVTLSVLVLGVVCTAIAFVAFFALIAEVGPVRATVITYINPAVALLLGVLVLREPLGAAAVTGFALILAGSVLTVRRSDVVPVALVAEP